MQVQNHTLSGIRALSAARQGMIALLVMLCAVGCSSTDATRGEVSGRVTIDGTPAAAGAIAFTPVDGASPTAGGKILDGRYSVKAPFGVAKIEIRVPKVVGQRKLYDTPDSPVQPLMEESLPNKFNDETQLTIDVKPGSNEHDFDLKSN